MNALKAIVGFNSETLAFQLTIDPNPLYDIHGWEDAVADSDFTTVFFIELSEDSNIYIENGELTMQDVTLIAELTKDGLVTY